jgi:hypothetical protein
MLKGMMAPGKTLLKTPLGTITKGTGGFGGTMLPLLNLIDPTMEAIKANTAGRGSPELERAYDQSVEDEITRAIGKGPYWQQMLRGGAYGAGYVLPWNWGKGVRHVGGGIRAWRNAATDAQTSQRSFETSLEIGKNKLQQRYDMGQITPFQYRRRMEALRNLAKPPIVEAVRRPSPPSAATLEGFESRYPSFGSVL